MQYNLNNPHADGPQMAGDGEGLIDSGALSNPFVGLRPFESTEALLFFGRDEQTTELMQQLHRTRFLAVVGSSGCGKSSLIRAGLIPKLKAGFLLNDRGRWRFATMKPGKAPLQNLAATLLAAFGEDPSGELLRPLVEEIEIKGVDAVTEYLARRLKGEETNILLLVDQFEEIFRFGSFTDEDPTEDPDVRQQRRAEAADFVSIMLELTRDKAIPVYVVMTMRSDFLGDCDAFHELPEVMNHSQYLVPRLTRHQRLEAIQCPVRLCGKTISAELAISVLDDMGDDSDQLPIMQHALMRTWEKFQASGAETVGVEHYEAIGTIRDALSRDADQALEEMDDEARTITKRMFQTLVETDAKGRLLRRPARLSEIEEVTGAARRRILEIIERFLSHNRSFLTLSEDLLSGDRLVDISHESLIRQWGKLSKWAGEEVESRELYLRLAGDAVRYCRGQSPLWRNPALQLALDWWRKRQPNKAWASRYHPRFTLAKGFLKRSAKKREAEEAAAQFLKDEQERRKREEYESAQKLAEERRRQAEELAAARQNQLLAAQELARQQASAARRQRRFIVALIAFSLVMLATSALAVFAMKKARTSEAKAVESLSREQRANDEVERQKAEAVGQKAIAEIQKAIAEEYKESAEHAQRAAEAATLEAKKQTALAKSKGQEAIDALNLAKERKAADQLHREATKEVEAVHYEQAQSTYGRAIGKYTDLGDLDGVAYTLTELGRMLTDLKDKDESPAAAPQLDSDTLTEVENVGHTNVLKGLLASEMNSERIPRVLNISETQKQGLKQYGQAIRLYRNKGAANGGFHDPNGSAAAYNKVGEFFTRNSYIVKNEKVQNKLTQLAIDSYCEASNDYYRANNLEGLISTLSKISDRIESSPTQAEQEARAKGTENLHKTDYAGCAEPEVVSHFAGAVDYLEGTLPLYRRLITQQSDGKEKAKLREGLSSMYIKIAELYLRHRDYIPATENYNRAVKVYEEIGDLKMAALTLQKIGDSSGDYSFRGSYYEKAAQEYIKMGKPGEAADVFKSLARIYLWSAIGYESEDIPASAEQLEEAIEAAEDSMHTYQNPAPAEAALEILRKALTIYTSAGNKLESAQVLKRIGDIETREARPKEAIAAYEQAANLYQQVGDPQSALTIRKLIEELKQRPSP
jgi:energy-coupling factor transporter ATP-binding protein EcfA2